MSENSVEVGVGRWVQTELSGKSGRGRLERSPWPRWEGPTGSARGEGETQSLERGDRGVF